MKGLRKGHRCGTLSGRARLPGLDPFRQWFRECLELEVQEQARPDLAAQLGIHQYELWADRL